MGQRGYLPELEDLAQNAGDLEIEKDNWVY